MQRTILRRPKGRSAPATEDAAEQGHFGNPYDFKTQHFCWTEWEKGYEHYASLPKQPTPVQPAPDTSGKLTGKQKALLVVVVLALIAWNALFVGPLMAVACVALVLVLACLDLIGLDLIAAAGVLLLLLALH